MPPPIRILAFRPPRPSTLLRPVMGMQRSARRSYAENDPSKLPKTTKEDVGPNMEQQEHVSEEAAKMAKIQGQQGPELDQGTPVQEILKEERETKQQAPQVLQDQVKKSDATTKPSTSTGGTRSFSTSTRQRLDLQSMPSSQPSLPPSMLPTPPPPSPPEPKPGHKFPLPETPLPKHLQKDHRQEEVITQLTNLLMRDGKKSVAQRNMAVILNTLRTAPAPTYSSTRSLLPGAPPATHLPLNPVLYLTLAIDSVAPLLRIRTQRGAAGGGVALQIPVPLGKRQRRRQAFQWILDSASKRQNRGSGKDMFAMRAAQELIAVVEGRSGVWEKRQGVHRLGTAARTNINWRKMRR